MLLHNSSAASTLRTGDTCADMVRCFSKGYFKQLGQVAPYQCPETINFFQLSVESNREGAEHDGEAFDLHFGAYVATSNMPARFCRAPTFCHIDIRQKPIHLRTADLLSVQLSQTQFSWLSKRITKSVQPIRLATSTRNGEQTLWRNPRREVCTQLDGLWCRDWSLNKIEHFRLRRFMETNEHRKKT